ncbi:MAG: GTP cyclohydrolase I [Myxococcales bacterium]|jgi:GTP cyclohydrolase I|nr:GTP cyclohydrolase I [Myxococcales bacterium]
MPDRPRAARAIEEFLRALDYDIDGELKETGARVADAWIDELVAGEKVDVARLLERGAIDLGPGPHGTVILRDVHVATMCPHHLLPAHGRATIGYLPGRRVAGIGVIAQVVDALARRLTLQESLGREIARSLQDGLFAEGAFCRLVLHHTCFALRGEKQHGAVLETLALTGRFDGDLRFMALNLAHGSAS